MPAGPAGALAPSPAPPAVAAQPGPAPVVVQPGTVLMVQPPAAGPTASMGAPAAPAPAAPEPGDAASRRPAGARHARPGPGAAPQGSPATARVGGSAAPAPSTPRAMSSRRPPARVGPAGGGGGAGAGIAAGAAHATVHGQSARRFTGGACVRAGPAAVKGLPADAPPLVISGAVYLLDPAEWLLIVNGQVFREGADLGSGVVLEKVQRDSAVLGFRGQRYDVYFYGVRPAGRCPACLEHTCHRQGRCQVAAALDDFGDPVADGASARCQALLPVAVRCTHTARRWFRPPRAVCSRFKVASACATTCSMLRYW